MPKGAKAIKLQFFTTYDVGRMTGTDPTTVMKWMDKGLMRAHRTPGGHRRVKAEDLRTFLLAHQMPLPVELGGAQSIRVLLVDDDAEVLKALSKGLARARPEWEILTRESALQALLAMPKLLPDVLVFDIFMPETDGFTLCKQLRKNEDTCSIRLLAMTGRGGAELEKKALAAGALNLLRKPLVPAALADAIESAVRMPMAAMAG